ncbi:unnamed protein product [Adineta steineri]|uniref:Uncharacterized protein n=1 Tax=Adineta steineri TaxID=433720 RepID=A0A815SFH2_9BILA|nr:unnamed protein product [Adineta steineri]CAF1489939.1 unnamed protein product [Adineta steineri]
MSKTLLLIFLLFFYTPYECRSQQDIQSDTWIAVDGLGRVLPNITQVGPPRPNRTVGMFYFLHLGHDGSVNGPYDVSKILKEHPEAINDINDPHWGPLDSSHIWGESLFGYYMIDDDFILRKHASMIVNAGVDVIIFDVSNAVTFRDNYQKLCSVYTDIRSKGGRTPQIAFLCPFGNPGDMGRKTTRAIYEDLYANGSYSDLWFRWKGKPLMLADPGYVDDDIRQFFTLRQNIGPYNQGPTGPNQWAWLEIYPQHVFLNSEGDKEEAAVGVAQNYNKIQYNSTAPMSWPGAFGRSYHNNSMDNRTDAVNWGFNFAEQWERALEIDPQFVFVTGWNEWTAGRYASWSRWTAPPVIFVDEFIQEFSRDIEPMSGGHDDNYYYQLVNYVRRYKGVRSITPVKASPIIIDGNFQEWQPVQPSFQTDPGTPVWRDYPGSGKAGPYINHTGRNDIIETKVSYNGDYVYFYVRTYNLTTNYTDPNWMLLFLNTDANYSTGWLGYDFVINRNVRSSQETSLERNNASNSYIWTKIADISYAMKGKELELMIPRKLLAIPASYVTIDFKWADNIQQDGTWSDFSLNGDSAPPDRFNFRAQLN